MIRYSLILYTLPLLVLLGCQSPDAKQTTEPPANPIAAVVDGQTIYRDDLLKVLMPVHGRKAVDCLIDLRLIEAYTKQQNIVCPPNQFEIEKQSILDDMAPHLSYQQQLAVLDYLLASRGMGRSELELLIRTQTLLRAAVDPVVNVTMEDLERQFNAEYGRRVQIRLLAVTNLRKLETVKRVLNEGRSLAELIPQYSEHPRSLNNQGLLGPFSAQDSSIPAEIRQAAFALNEIAQRSDVINYFDDVHTQWWAILELVQIIPAAEKTLNDVENELRETIQRQTITQRMQALQQHLRQQARIQYVDPLLKTENLR